MFVKSLWGRLAPRAPENDEGFEYEEPQEEATDLDEGEDDADEGFEDGEEDVDGQEGPDDVGADEGQEGRSAEVSRTRSRAADRVATATRIAAEAKRRAEAAEQRLALIEQAQHQNMNRESAAQREQRLAMMDPDQRVQFLLQEQAQSFRSEINAIRFEAQDSADRTAFEALCARNPVAAKHHEKVEAELQRLRAAGQTAPRTTILKYVIGDSALAATPRARNKAAQAAAGNRARQVARPASGRSDVSSSSGRGDDRSQRFNRLKDLEL
jgi:hypothetical protein